MLSAASCKKWWNEEILKTKDFAAEQSGITKLGENQVFYLPYLMGERSPHNNPDARAMFIGMSMDTTREDILQRKVILLLSILAEDIYENNSFTVG